MSGCLGKCPQRACNFVRAFNFQRGYPVGSDGTGGGYIPGPNGFDGTFTGSRYFLTQQNDINNPDPRFRLIVKRTPYISPSYGAFFAPYWWSDNRYTFPDTISYADEILTSQVFAETYDLLNRITLTKTELQSGLPNSHYSYFWDRNKDGVKETSYYDNAQGRMWSYTGDGQGSRGWSEYIPGPYKGVNGEPYAVNYEGKFYPDGIVGTSPPPLKVDSGLLHQESPAKWLSKFFFVPVGPYKLEFVPKGSTSGTITLVTPTDAEKANGVTILPPSEQGFIRMSGCTLIPTFDA